MLYYLYIVESRLSFNIKGYYSLLNIVVLILYLILLKQTIYPLTKFYKLFIISTVQFSIRIKIFLFFHLTTCFNTVPIVYLY